MSQIEGLSLPANRDNSDFVRNIPAGEEREIVVIGDFIYCKAAGQGVDVIVNGKTTRMQAGDVRRVGTPFRGVNLRNPDRDNAVNVEFVIGFGDFDRKIIEGVVGSESILKNSLGRVSTDTRQTVEFTLAPSNISATPYDQGELIREFKTNVTSPLGTSQNKTCDGPNGEIWYLVRGDEDFGEDKYYMVARITRDGYVISTQDRVAFSSPVNSAYADFGYSPLYGLVGLTSSGAHQGHVFIVETGELLAELPVDGAFMRTFCFARDSVIVYHRNDDTAIAYDVESKQIIHSRQIGFGGIQASEVRYDAVYNNVWFIHGANALHILDAGTFEKVAAQTNQRDWLNLPTGTTRWVVKGNQIISAKPNTEPLEIQEFAGIDFVSTPTFSAYSAEGELSHALHSNRDYTGDASISVNAITTGAVVEGQVIKCALEAFYGRRLPADYMDHVYFFAASRGAHGRPTKAIGGGNRTLKAISLTDNGAILAPCKITVTIDDLIKMGGFI